MGRKSTIDKLPPDLRKRLIELLQNPAVTQEEITDTINSMAGGKAVSRSSVNRYAARMEEFTRRSRQAKEVAELYLERAGENRQGTLGKLVNEQVRLMTFELMMAFSNVQKRLDSDPEATKELADVVYKVSRSIKELELASQKNLETEKALRTQIAEEVAGETRRQGLSEETVKAIKSKILGVA